MTDKIKREEVIRVMVSREEKDNLKNQNNLYNRLMPFARFCREKLLGKVK